MKFIETKKNINNSHLMVKKAMRLISNC